MTSPESPNPESNTLRRSHRRLEEAHEKLRRAIEEIAEELERLDARVKVLRRQWSGQSQEMYDLAQREWMQRLRHMQELLDDYNRRLARIDERYREASTKIQGTIWS